jgi:Ni,Fe-hydrogenase III large subunit
MKKIFVLEINEKDKKIDNYEIINDLEKQFKEFSEIISANNSLYLRFKRVGNTWQNIIDKAKNTKQNTKNNYKDISENKKTNHLKVVK